MNIMIQAGLIDEFFDGITSRIGNWFTGFADWFYLAEWWILGFIILAVALVVSWFFGALPVIGGWIRGASGAIVLLFGAFLVGITVAARHYREQQQKVPPPKSQPPTTPTNTGGGSGFDWFKKG